MPSVRHNKPEARSNPYDIFKLPGAHKPPPKTPEQLLELVKKHHANTRAQRLLGKNTYETCKHCCETTIDHSPTDQPVTIRTPLRYGRHQALQLSDKVKRSLNVSLLQATDDEQEASAEV